MFHPLTIFRLGRSKTAFPTIPDEMIRVDYTAMAIGATLVLSAALTAPLKRRVYHVVFVSRTAFIGYLRFGTTNVYPLDCNAKAPIIDRLWPAYLEQAATGLDINIINNTGAAVTVSALLLCARFI